MDLSPFEQHIFAYYVANAAGDFTMAPRFWPYGELVLIIADKINVATRGFGPKAGVASPNVARAFLDLLIEREAFSAVPGRLGGTMHQYQTDNYRKCIADLQQTDPIILQAQAAGPGFWEQALQ